MNFETDPQVLFFVSAAERYYKENFSEKQFKKFNREFKILVEENSDSFDDELKKKHIINPLFIISVYRSIRDEVDDIDLLKTHVIYGMYGSIII